MTWRREARSSTPGRGAEGEITKEDKTTLGGDGNLPSLECDDGFTGVLCQNPLNLYLNGQRASYMSIIPQ